MRRNVSKRQRMQLRVDNSATVQVTRQNSATVRSANTRASYADHNPYGLRPIAAFGTTKILQPHTIG